MDKYKYVIRNFFTYKDNLIDPKYIPGTLFTPLHLCFYSICLFLIIYLAYKVSKKKDNIKVIFKRLFFTIVILEIGIVLWDTFAREINHFDLKEGLSLYPCSIFMYTLPFIIWGNNNQKKMAYGYLGTLGLLGSVVNLLYPYRLENYSCFSFCALHSLFYHGSMLFVLLVLLFSHEKVYSARSWKELFYPCIPVILVSIPANIINFSSIDSDYMYFKGYHPLARKFFPTLGPTKFAIYAYIFYIFSPLLFYLPSYINNKIKESGNIKINAIYDNLNRLVISFSKDNFSKIRNNKFIKNFIINGK